MTLPFYDSKSTVTYATMGVPMQVAKPEVGVELWQAPENDDDDEEEWEEA